jgi:beta-lactamase class A
MSETAAAFAKLVGDLLAQLGRGTSAAVLDDPVMRDPPRPLDAGFAPDGEERRKRLQDQVDLLERLNEWPAGFSWGLVDLTDGTPRLAVPTQRREETAYVASMAKIAAMYAAFQLRADARALAAATTAQSEGALLDEIETKWHARLPAALKADIKRAVTTTRWDRAQHRTVTSSRPGAPAFRDLLAARRGATGWVVDFKRALPDGSRPGDPPDAERKLVERLMTVDEQWAAVAELSFAEWLKLMIGWSDNVAATVCIRTLGYRYVRALLESSRLYRTETETGLWLAGDYAGEDWIARQCVPHLDAAGKVVQATTQGCAVVAATTFMTLLALGKLVDSEASAEMLALMKKAGPWGSHTWSPIREAIGPGSGSTVYSKHGQVYPSDAWDGTVSDCAYFERRLPNGTDVRYVAVVLGFQGQHLPATLGTGLQRIIQDLHSP